MRSGVAVFAIFVLLALVAPSMQVDNSGIFDRFTFEPNTEFCGEVIDAKIKMEQTGLDILVSWDNVELAGSIEAYPSFSVFDEDFSCAGTFDLPDVSFTCLSAENGTCSYSYRLENAEGRDGYEQTSNEEDRQGTPTTVTLSLSSAALPSFSFSVFFSFFLPLIFASFMFFSSPSSASSSVHTRK
eukprot:TRINITY_DN3251_c0_g1_i1.p1 TRINITY_DN3251_c0_g1~~TRINITY_DN3251_c0_g1_i1.p1  ORF type:complete len:197 (-),score=81.79 TRINITY_DN3251_c0_g1_i1:11-565(-)